MSRHRLVRMWIVIFSTASLVLAPAPPAPAQETAAQAGEKLGVFGTFVRAAETDEGWVVVGYRAANGSVGNDWMLLDVGITLMKGVDSQKLSRDDVFLVTPHGQKITLPTQSEYQAASAKLAALERKANVMRDSIDYFPTGTDQPCRIGFFTDLEHPMRGGAYDEVELSSRRACVGRLYFEVPDGIEIGTYNLDVQLAGSVVRVPLEIMTDEQAKEFEKKWKESKKKHGDR